MFFFFLSALAASASAVVTETASPTRQMPRPERLQKRVIRVRRLSRPCPAPVYGSPYFSVMIFLRSAMALFICVLLSSSCVTLSQELMIVEWSRLNASPMRGRLMFVISRVR